jgi:hypothetical protein
VKFHLKTLSVLEVDVGTIDFYAVPIGSDIDTTRWLVVDLIHFLVVLFYARSFASVMLKGWTPEANGKLGSPEFSLFIHWKLETVLGIWSGNNHSGRMLWIVEIRRDKFLVFGFAVLSYDA